MTQQPDDPSDRAATTTRDREADVEFARRPAPRFDRGTSVPDVVRQFVRRFGWRAYAVPILVVLTVVALCTTRGTAPTATAADSPGSPSSSASSPASSSQSATTAQQSSTSSVPVAPPTIPLKSDVSGGSKVREHALRNASLPAGPPFTMRGDGTFSVIPGTSKVSGTTGTLYRYDIEIENGITGVNKKQFASMVQHTLADPRSWSGHGVRVQRVDSGYINFRVTLTSAMTVRKYCGYTIKVESSCYAAYGSAPVASVNRVVFDVARWVRGAAPYVGDLHSYRLYMINHEDGHAMGHEHAHRCLPGGVAPVMMQQTFGLKSAVTGRYCTANPWPYPPGVRGAPGAEALDTPQNSEFSNGTD